MNVHDSSRISQILTSLGWQASPNAKEADLIIVNSCSVRAKPEHKALSEAGRHQQARKSRGAKVILAGCVAQQGGQQLLQKASGLDAVIGPDAICRLPQILQQLQTNRTPLVDIDEHDLKNPCFVPLVSSKTDQISVPVTIMKGCNNFCSYCIVPYVRGRESSREVDDILDEVRQLAAAGCREVVLLGQNVNSYHDPSGHDFPELLDELNRQAAVERIRFTTSHPKDLSVALTKAVSRLDRVCEHIHLGLQSGSTRILKSMNRDYSQEDFTKKALELRKAIPGLSLTTDIIVGFPSETWADFQKTLDVVEEVAFDQAFSFMYSPRPKTLASKMVDDVVAEEKARRLLILQELLNKLESASLAKLCNRTLQILVEKTSRRDENAMSGRTRCNRVVNFETHRTVLPGETVDIIVDQVRGHTLWGRLGTNNMTELP